MNNVIKSWGSGSHTNITKDHRGEGICHRTIKEDHNHMGGTEKGKKGQTERGNKDSSYKEEYFFEGGLTPYLTLEKN